MSMTVRRALKREVARQPRTNQIESIGGPERGSHTPPPAVQSNAGDWWQEWLGRGCIASYNSLVEYYMAQHVRKIAGRMRALLPHHVDLDDLVQQGYLGLVDSMTRFDPARGIRFETFSSQRISGSMRDWLRSLDHVPRLMRRRAKVLQQAIDAFLAGHGRHPDPDELRILLGELPEDELGRVLGEDAPPVVVTISTVSSGGEDDPVSIPERRSSSPSSSAQRADLKKWITRDLDDVDGMIVTLYYYESLTMKEIGATIGCSESRVSQRLDSILQRLRSRVDLTPERFLSMAG